MGEENFTGGCVLNVKIRTVGYHRRLQEFENLMRRQCRCDFFNNHGFISLNKRASFHRQFLHGSLVLATGGSRVALF